MKFSTEDLICFCSFCGKFQDIIAVFFEARVSYGPKISTWFDQSCMHQVNKQQTWD